MDDTSDLQNKNGNRVLKGTLEMYNNPDVNAPTILALSNAKNYFDRNRVAKQTLDGC